jgi:hypothetical protein
MGEKLSLLLVLALAMSACGMVEVEGEVLNPTELLELQTLPTATLSSDTLSDVDEKDHQSSQGILPAPIIYLGVEDEAAAPGSQDLWQLEVDGVTAQQITNVAMPITSFAVSPRDGAIAYTTFDQNDLVRIDADGTNRTVLVDGPDLSSQPQDDEWSRVSNANVVWSPDGSQIAYGYGGVRIVPAVGGEPRVLIPDKIVTVSGRLSQESRYYRPLAWSPDGTKILALEGFGVEGSGYAVVNVDNGEVLSLGSTVLCCEPGWSRDSQSFYFSSATFGMIVPGLWQVNVHSGDVRTIIRGMERMGLPEDTGEQMVLVQSAQELQDGHLYAFTATGTYEELFIDEQSKTEIFPRLTMSSISSEGKITPLRVDAYVLGEALWAEDASGAVITVMEEDDYPSGSLLWIPGDGSEPVLLGGRGFQPKWGMEVPQP